MFYVGLDIHTKRIAFCVLSEKGQLVQRGQVRGLQEVLRWNSPRKVDTELRGG